MQRMAPTQRPEKDSKTATLATQLLRTHPKSRARVSRETWRKQSKTVETLEKASVLPLGLLSPDPSEASFYLRYASFRSREASFYLCDAA